ncbi:MAG: amidohydrolase family protein [Pirellulaceae bacterium]
MTYLSGSTDNLPSRRQFLAAAMVSGLGSSLLAQEEPHVMRVDTHVHCFAGPEDARFPFHPQAPYEPAEPATPQHLLRCMDGAGVDRAIIVHPEPYQDDHRYLEHCLDVGQGRLKGTVLLFADDPQMAEKMTRLAQRGDIVAARIHAYAPERMPPDDIRLIRALWRQATQLGLAVQLHFEPRYAPRFEPLIREFRETPVIIDHLGRPFQGTPQEHQVVIDWAKYPHTTLKLSAIPAKTSYPHRDIAPVIRRLCDAYGPGRLIHGGGSGASATGASYRAAFERTAQYLAHFNPAEQAQALGGNAARLFHL